MKQLKQADTENKKTEVCGCWTRTGSGSSVIRMSGRWN